MVISIIMSFVISDVSYQLVNISSTANNRAQGISEIEISNDGNNVVISSNSYNPTGSGWEGGFGDYTYNAGWTPGEWQFNSTYVAVGQYMSLSSNGLALTISHGGSSAVNFSSYSRDDLDSTWNQVDIARTDINRIHKMSGDGLTLAEISGNSIQYWKRNSIDASFSFYSTFSGDLFGLNEGHKLFAISEDGNRVFAKYKVYDISGDVSYNLAALMDSGDTIIYGHLSKNGKRVVLGIHTSGSTYGSDRVKVYEFNDSSWNQVGHTIEENISHEGSTYNDANDDEDSTGSPCVLSGDGNTLVVSAMNYRDVVGAQSRGRVRIFKYFNAMWNEVGHVDGPQYRTAQEEEPVTPNHRTAFYYKKQNGLFEPLNTNNPNYARFGQHINVNYDGSRVVVSEGYFYHVPFPTDTISGQQGKLHIYDIEYVISNICFPAGEFVLTDLGYKKIETVTTKDTIRNKKIEAITQTKTNDSYLIQIPKDSFYTDMPNKNTLITQNHKVLYKGKLVYANHLLREKIGCKKVKYNKEVLYNVLYKDEGKMVVNNMIVETLSPSNSIARLYKMISGKNVKERTELIQGYKKYVDDKGNFKGKKKGI